MIITLHQLLFIFFIELHSSDVQVQELNILVGLGQFFELPINCGSGELIQLANNAVTLWAKSFKILYFRYHIYSTWNDSIFNLSTKLRTKRGWLHLV